MTEWVGVRPELDPPEILLPLPESAVRFAVVRRIGLDWDVDAVLCADPSNAWFHPGVIVRPRAHLNLLPDAVRSAYDLSNDNYIFRCRDNYSCRSGLG